MGAFFLSLHPDSPQLDQAQAARAVASLRACLPLACRQQVTDVHTAVIAGASIDPTGFDIDGDLLLLDGALSVTCRSELQRTLGLPQSADAVIVQRAFALWGAAAASRLEGRFALVLVDRRRACVWLLRDVLGECSLYFSRSASALSVSTSVSTLIAAQCLPKVENATAIAAFFALRAPAPGSCFWQGVQALQAGECLCVSATTTRSTKRTFDLSGQPVKFASDAAAVAAWQAVLQAACGRAVAAARRPAVLLSGGIDSTALAAISAGLRPDLLAVSWRLPAFPSADESALIAATAGQLGIELRSTLAAADWPLARLSAWSMDPDTPLVNPYRWLQHGVLQQAFVGGADVILSGNFGDHLYPDSPQPRSPWRRLRQRLLRRLDPYPRLLAGLRWAARVPSTAPDWLLPKWRPSLPEQLPSLPPVLTHESMQDANLGRSFAARFGLDLRFVYRDPEVIRFMAALPRQWMQRDQTQKWITREVLRGHVPEAVRERRKSGSLEPYFRFGVCQQEAAAVAELLHRPDVRWPRYVRADALLAALANPATEAELLLIWLAISYELWWRAQWGLGPAMLASGPLPPVATESLP